MNNEKVLQLVDELFHEFASSFCNEARLRAIEKIKAYNRSDVPCGDCFELLPLDMECDNPSCVRVIIRNHP